MKSRSAILREVGIFEIKLTPEKMEQYERINEAYSRAVEKRFEARRKLEVEARAYWNKHGPWYF
jgi:hypothetical protein